MDNTGELHPIDQRFKKERDSFKYVDGKQVPISNNGVQNVQVGVKQSSNTGFDNTDRFHPSDVRYGEGGDSIKNNQNGWTGRQLDKYKGYKRKKYQRNATRIRRDQRRVLGLIGKKPTILKKSFLRSRAITVGITALSWVFWVWLIQLTFAVLLLVAMGASAAIEANWWLEKAGELAQATLALFGLDFISMASLMFISWAMVLFLGMVTLMGVGLQYKIAFLKPLGGNKTEIKYAFLLLAIVGYCIPGLNLFPWVFLWIGILILYPK